MKYLPLFAFIFVVPFVLLAEGIKAPRKSALKKTVSTNKDDPATKSTKRVKFSDQYLDDSIGKDPLNQILPKEDRKEKNYSASASQIRRKKQEAQEAKAMIRSSTTATGHASSIAPQLGLLTVAVLAFFIIF